MTLTLVHSQPDAVRIIAPDVFLRRPDGSYEWTPSRLKEAWRLVQLQFVKALQASPPKAVLVVGLPNSGKSAWLSEHGEAGPVYVDSSLTQKRQRKWFIERAHDCNVPVECVWLDVPFSALVERNNARPKERRVPTRKLLAMFEAFEEPSVSEGFMAVAKVPFESEGAA